MDLQLGSTKALIDECRRQGLLRNQCAYVLATAYHETAHTMKPIAEYGKGRGRKYGKPGRNNKQVPYGRGFVQTTWDDNYERTDKELGLKGALIKNYNLLLTDAKMAAKAAITGMREGWYTGKKLSDYLTASKTDYPNARRIINGKDKAALIENYARDYEMDLQVTGYGQARPASARPAAAATIPAIEPKPAPAPLPVPDSSIIEGAQKRLTELKYNPGGIDGKIGPLTGGAIRIFRADNGLPEGDFIDSELLTALATAQPRKMVPERANATGADIAAKVPEASAHSWNKLLALGSAAVTAAGGAVDYIAPAVSYLQPIQDFIGDVPKPLWIAAIVLVAGVVWWNARAGQKAADEAYRAGDRR